MNDPVRIGPCPRCGKSLREGDPCPCAKAYEIKIRVTIEVDPEP